MPVGHRSDRDPGAKAVGVGHRIQGESPAPTPSPPTEPVLIELRIFRQYLVERRKLIGQLNRPHVVIASLLEIAPAPRHSPIVDMQNREAVL